MDKSLFTENKQGQLIKIAAIAGAEWAFLPDPLPEKWDVPADLWPLLVEAREEIARLDGVGRHMPNYELLLRPLQRREALKSSSLEGTFATPEQLLLFEIGPKEPKSQTDRVNAWKEVFNYGSALKSGQRLLDEIPISIRLIKELHKELLSGVRGHHRDPGNFRRTQVHIGSDKRFIPPPPPAALNCLNDLETYLHRDHAIDGLVFCFMVHYQFEAIHPFLDGNGRVGRLLLALMIYKWCKLKSPWLYLSAYFDRYKDEYIDRLFNVSARGDWRSWIEFCLKASISEAKDAVRRFDKLVSLRDTYLRAISDCGGSIRLNQVIEKLLEFPAITIPRVAEMLQVTYPTAKTNVELMIRCNILSEGDLGLAQRPKLFVAAKIMEAAYGDLLDESEPPEKATDK